MNITYHIIEKPQFNLDVKFIEFDVAEAYNGFLRISFRKRKDFYYEGADILIILNEVYYFLKDIIDKKEYPQLNIIFSPFCIAKIKGDTVILSNGQRDNFDDFIIDRLTIKEVEIMKKSLDKFIMKYGFLKRNE